MGPSMTNNVNKLDQIRIEKGKDHLKQQFQKLASEEKDQVTQLLNDQNLQFSTLFILRPDIEKYDLENVLNLRNREALMIVNHIAHARDQKPKNNYSYYPEMKDTLKWMFETGALYDGNNDDFDEVMDDVATILIKVFNDTTILPIVVKIIFSRNRKKLFIHDLEWVFFEGRHPESMYLVAEYLRSNRAEDIILAKKMLHFIPNLDDTDLMPYGYEDLPNGLFPTSNSTYANLHGFNAGAQIRANIRNRCRHGNNSYIHAVNWLKENQEYIEYTGESFQQTNSPSPYTLSLEDKYLCRRVSNKKADRRKKQSGEPLDADNAFKKLNAEAKELLSEYSSKLKKLDDKMWEEWRKCPIAEQIKIAAKKRI